MARRKKSGGLSKASSRKTSQAVRIILGYFLYLFIFVAIFSRTGFLVATVNEWLRQLFGIMTPALAFFLGWFICRKYWPDRFGARFNTIAGTILLTVTLAALAHSFTPEEMLSMKGVGGGLLGYYVYNGLYVALGSIMGRALLFVLFFVSIVIVYEQAIPLLLGKNDDEEESINDGIEGKVKVMGEIPAMRENPLRRFGRFGRHNPEPVVPVKPVQPVVPRSANWNYPPLTLLNLMGEKPEVGNLNKRMEMIQKTLRDFGIEVTMVQVNVGPAVSQYTLRPADGVKLNQITARQDDIALALAAQSIRVEAPIPGKGLVGVEIPNEKRANVGLRDIAKSPLFAEYPSKLVVALGRGADGSEAVIDLAKMPHILIAGATGSGKSVCINTLLISLLLNNSPDELRLILVDPKRVELTLFNGIPHLLTPVIIEPKDTVRALSWCIREMERRYKVLAANGKRNIEQYNEEPNLAEGKMPYIVVLIDELADLMMASAREVEAKIVRLAQMSRAVGIHLVIATQRPSVDVITGLIKANIPARIAFAVTSQVDSRTIIDGNGAEKLLGQGDMLYISTEFGKPKRVQGAFCSEDEITSVIGFIRKQEPADRYEPSVLEEVVESRFVSAGGLDDEEEQLVREAYELVQKHRKASTSMLQTYLKLGYNKAKRIVTAMEERGMIGPERGGRQREVYDVDLDGGGAISPNNDDQSQAGIVPYPENE